jgi:DNA processing protein
MLQERELLILLSTKGLTHVRYQRILAQHTSLIEWWRGCGAKNKFPEWLKLTTASELDMEYFVFAKRHSDREILDDEFPSCLLVGNDTPIVLYYKGVIALLSQQHHFLTIIGSRNHSLYAQTVISNIVPMLIGNGIIPISGLAEGVDGLVHLQATSLGKPTVAVIGSGLDIESFYPKSNNQLYDDILRTNGLVLSEYPIGYQANMYTFPQRNRILAALSRCTWVVEASQKSGSMTTVAKCMKYSKQLLVSPVNLYIQHCSGNVSLMRQGATIVYDDQDILTLYSQIEPKSSNSLETNSVFSQEHSLLQYISNSPTHFDEIVTKSGLSNQECSSILSELELDGLVCHVGQNLWKKNTL